MPEVKAYSFRSKLYHEKMIEQIVKTKINKLAYDFNDSSNEKLKVNEKDDEMMQKLERRRNCKEFIYLLYSKGTTSDRCHIPK